MNRYATLLAYKKAFKLAMEVFEVSKRFPKEEKYSLTDQIRRSSRSVCANFAEAFNRTKYRAHFISKMWDSDTENSETQVWLDFSLACQYISNAEHEVLSSLRMEVGKLLGDIIFNPDKYI